MKTFQERKNQLFLTLIGSYTFKKECYFPKSQDRIPIGTTVALYVTVKVPSKVFFQYGVDSAKTISWTQCHAYFLAIGKPPTLKTMERWNNDGISKTPLGEVVEPDGYGPSGAPSWLLAMGII